MDIKSVATWTDSDKRNNFTAWTEGRHTDTAENMDQRPGEDGGGGCVRWRLNSWKTQNHVKLGFHPQSANMYADRMEIWY